VSNNIEVAKKIVEEAAKTIGVDRPGVHGPAENSFQMIADLWSVYINHVHYARNLSEIHVQLQPVDVAQMMVQLKQARAIYGRKDNRDNFVDETGYSALAGMLQLPDIGTPKKEGEDA